MRPVAGVSVCDDGGRAHLGGVRCAAPRWEAANPSLKLGRFDDRGLAALSRGQFAIANCLKNFCPAHPRAYCCFIGIETKPRDGATRYIWLYCVQWCTHVAFCGIPPHSTECTKRRVMYSQYFLLFLGSPENLIAYLIKLISHLVNPAAFLVINLADSRRATDPEIFPDFLE